ncbi:MAG: phosphoribosylglycinamide formyltransferase [Flavobacteriaceae bacterium]|nr:phosphoribosylglycinamide formyltransferase [Flavobacteriaceae bacterium]
MKKRIVVFASGNGTNAQNIIEHFQQGEFAEVVQVLSNNEHAKVLERAKALKTKASHFNKSQLHSEEGVLKTLQKLQPDLIVLAGFLWKFPEIILNAFPNKVINVHPALLPKYGGKGMYGMNVHKAVVENEETETGITIHYVNEHYDEGVIICQKKTTIEKGYTPEEVAKKVHELEYKNFPIVIEELLMQESEG